MNIQKHLSLLATVAEDVIPVANARLAAAVIYKNKIISIGTNQYKSHPFALRYSKNPDAIFLHAEADAILKATKKISNKQLTKSSLIVARIKLGHDRKPMFGLARPCGGCRSCIIAHGLSKTVYTNDSTFDNIAYTVCEHG